MSNPTIVFSSHSLYIEGVVNRFQQLTNTLDTYYIKPDAVDYLQRIADLKPSVVIIDANEINKRQHCLLCDLISNFPNIMILQLKVHEKEVQMIQSTSHFAENVKELVHLINDHWINKKGGGTFD